MMARKDSPSQVVKMPVASLTQVSLPLRLCIVSSVLGNFLRGTIRAVHSLWPPHLPHRLEALRVIDERLNVDHHVRNIGLRASSCNATPSTAGSSGQLPGSQIEPYYFSITYG
jgi:hypothetical protein